MKLNTIYSNEKWNIEDKYLRLKRKSIRKLINLPPKYLGNINKGIEEAIFRSNAEICKELSRFYHLKIIKLIA
jgi:hypothetical protein